MSKTETTKGNIGGDHSNEETISDPPKTTLVCKWCGQDRGSGWKKLFTDPIELKFHQVKCRNNPAVNSRKRKMVKGDLYA